MDDEMASHLEEAADDYVARGLSREEARLAAIRDFGGIAQAKEAHREVRAITWPDDVRQDVKYAVRRLCKDRSFTLIAVATLALGIGVNTAVFSVVNGVLLNPLPYPAPDRLVAVYWRTADQPRDSSSYPNFLDWARRNSSFSHLAAYRPDALNLIGAGQPERVPVEMVSASFFPLLGVQPILGRMFVSAEDEPGAAPVALIGEHFWTRKFGAAPTAIGRTLTLGGTSYVVIGVISATFEFPARNFHPSDIYLPIGAWNAPGFHNRQVSKAMDVAGRLKPGVSPEQADADLQAVARGLANEYPDVNKDTGIALEPLKSAFTAPVRPLLLLLVTAVLFVLLIAVVNVANEGDYDVREAPNGNYVLGADGRPLMAAPLARLQAKFGGGGVMADPNTPNRSSNTEKSEGDRNTVGSADTSQRSEWGEGTSRGAGTSGAR